VPRCSVLKLVMTTIVADDAQLNAEPSISCHLDAFWESMYLR
jgi:hypothetical protein